ncbi:MAG: universal stress protein [Pyrinomonadaceae bacterium]
MKILVGYDSSECADSALRDLENAGLPKAAEVVVMTIADVFVPPPLSDETDREFPLYESEAIRRAHKRAEEKVQQAQLMAERASERLLARFSGWRITPETIADSPAWALIRKSDEWEPDLIVLGASGHSVLGGRLILGSVSQRVLYEASCSVRVARGHSRTTEAPLRLIIGVDSSSDSGAAIDAVCRREWPKGTEVRLLAVVDTVMALTPDPSQPSIMRWIEVEEEENWDEVRKIFQPAADKLRSAGLDAAVMISRGSPADQLIEEAETWGADCVFVGAKGTRGIERLLLGSVSSAVSARAHCSVEIVRRKS